MTARPVRPNRAGALALAGILAALAVRAQTPAPDIGPALDRIAARLKVGFSYTTWSATAKTTVTAMDRSWTPESVTTVAKTVKVVKGDREEVILKAEETKKGRTRDITREFADQARRDRDRERRRRADERTRSGGDGRRGGRMDLDEILPFSAKKRGEYVFRLTEGDLLGDKEVAIFDVEAKIKDQRHFEGRFWFDPGTYDLLQAEVKPADYPAMVKELAFRMAFEPAGSGFLAIKSFVVRVNGGFFLKHIRQVVEETYSDIVIVD